MSVDTLIYIIQLSVLAVLLCLLMLCLYLAWRSRRAMNGMARITFTLIASLMLLIPLLAIRRLDDLLNILESNTILILSSAVVIAFGVAVVSLTLEMYRVFSNRGIYEMQQHARRMREDELEAMREKSERTIGAWSR